MSLIKNLISESLREQESHLLLEALKVDPAAAKEMMNTGAALSGATLAAVLASVETVATTAGVKGLLLAAGFTNPATIATLGAVVVGLKVATAAAVGWKKAYNMSTVATRVAPNASESHMAVEDLLAAVIERDKALSQKKKSLIIKTTEEIHQKAMVLRRATIKDFKKGVIDKKTYQSYLNLAEKGVVGRLSTLV